MVNNKFVKPKLLKTTGDVGIEAIKVLSKMAKQTPLVGALPTGTTACRFCFARANTRDWTNHKKFHKKSCLWIKANKLMEIYEDLE